jgi:tRNA(adenine34) deaminase
MMERCIALAMHAVDVGEYPYAAVICRNGQVVCESINSVGQDHDVTHHAEVVAMSKALHRLNRVSLEDCTIFANAEPCALCCYAMRETRIGRVVFGIPAPLTGGLTRWNILADTKLSDTLPEVFAPPPEIVPGFMHEQVEAAIAHRTPLVWDFIRARNIFGGPLPSHILALATANRRHNFQQRTPGQRRIGTDPALYRPHDFSEPVRVNVIIGPECDMPGI